MTQLTGQVRSSNRLQMWYDSAFFKWSFIYLNNNNCWTKGVNNNRTSGLPVRYSNHQAVFLALGVRDYIHVVDLAKGHIAALKKLKENCGYKVRGSVSSFFRPSCHSLVFLSTFSIVLLCAGVQSGNRKRLHGATDDPCYGEGVRKGGAKKRQFPVFCPSRVFGRSSTINSLFVCADRV